MLSDDWWILIRSKTQITFTCSKSAKETLEKGVKYVQVNNPFSSVSIVDFEQVYVSWEGCLVNCVNFLYFPDTLWGPCDFLKEQR